MQKAEKKLSIIIKKYGTIIKEENLSNLDIIKQLGIGEFGYGKNIKKFIFGIIIVLIAVFSFKIYTEYDEKCIIEMPIDTTKVFRKAENCRMCSSIKQVDRVTNISPNDFEYSYAHTGRPVIIEDGTRNWTAPQIFNFNFFKQLYDKPDLDNRQDDCQFFPYKTEFKNLQQVFNMSQERSRLEPGTEPWYVGWSNCNNHAGQELRKHYSRPYFLPNISENIALAWIFMGGPGPGAHMHVDNVVYPSWQAQLSGKKQWRLMPPPECLYECQELLVTVQPGQIIVVDTNRWYHQTKVMDGQISITIGSEFD